MSRISIAEEIENAADRTADTVAGRSSDHLESHPIDLSPRRTRPIPSPAEMKIGRMDLIQVVLWRVAGNQRLPGSEDG